jgi:dinuclear metal center YbgI/SA1388 family protein
MIIRDLIDVLEAVAPQAYQEDYDNAGLIVGNANRQVTAVLISLDCTEEIIQEAISKGCNLIISHHPIVFRGLKKFNGTTYVERVVMQAIRHDIALYAIHTNLDHVYTGVNRKICERLGLTAPQILLPKAGLMMKLSTFVPSQYAAAVRRALFQAGAGNIGNYSNCSYNVDGYGTFKALEEAKPFVGAIGDEHLEPEVKVEVVFPAHLERVVTSALKQAHPYEEIAFDLYQLANAHPQVGSGMVGSLPSEMDEIDFLQLLKERLGAKVVRYTKLRHKKVRRVAVCGGAGSFLLKTAIAAKADVFVTSDFKYHEFFDAEEKLVIADVGHFESEQFTQQLLFDIIRKKFPNFALHLTEYNTNPINYLI